MIQKKLIYILLLFTCSIALAEEGEEGVPVDGAKPSDMKENETARIGGLDAEQEQQLALSEDVKPQEIVWLSVKYTEQDVPTKVLALEQAPRTALPQGAVLILHDKEQHADWPHLIRPLRKALPNNGWHTLSVNLPYDIIRKVPARSLSPKTTEEVVMTDALKQNLLTSSSRMKSSKDAPAGGDTSSLGTNNPDSEETSNDELASPNADIDEGDPEGDGEPLDIDLAEQKKNKSKAPYLDRAGLHVLAAMDHLAQKGYQNIIILAYRSGAELALKYIQSRLGTISDRGFALVMVDPILSTEFQLDISTALGERFLAPVLDLVDGTNLDQRALAFERESSARVAKILKYTQVNVVIKEDATLQKSLYRRIRFWLEKYAPGMSRVN